MRGFLFDRRWMLGAAVLVVTVTGCDTEETPRPDPSPIAATAAPPTPPPWTVDDLTYHPCSVLGPDDFARFVLEPQGKPATPPKALPRCSWSSIQTGPTGSFTIGFAPNTSDHSDLDRRRVRDPLERTITIGDRRAALAPSVRPDGSNGGCSVDVSVPSGGSFYVGIAVSGIDTGVDWDVCAKTIDVATVITARMR
ncbi:DUF3558 family protein [Nocardia sp. bgisy118]|uniref:DUF3558 family protein n=1 Tax=Nocardia sp. bgisy118 TaxID=3413786 RepID=UPI003F4A4E6C